jgi:hypothetical protein
MNKATAALLATLLSLGLSACDIRADDTPAPPGAQAGYATGIVLDMRGKPIAGARILLDNSVYYASYIHGSTGADGRYRIKPQPGAWKAEASIRKDYNGRTYTLELHPDSIDSFDESGAVRNFVWKLEGRTPDSDYGYYGGFIQLSTDLDFEGELEDIELTLTPSGPLIDGSPGRTLQLRKGDHYWVDAWQIEDVPIGRYRVTALLRGGDGDRPLRIRDWHARGDFVDEFQLDFLPKSGSTNNAASIVIGY